MAPSLEPATRAGVSSPRRRRLAVLLLPLLIVVQVGVQLVGQQVASASTCGTFVNGRQTGYSTYDWQGGSQPTTYEGSSADILDRGGYTLCNGDNSDNNFSATWTMVFGHSNGYAQAGLVYRATYAGCVKRWAEQDVNGSFADFYMPGCSHPGETHLYYNEAVLISGAWHMRSLADTTVLHQSSWSPFQYWTEPFGVQWKAEAPYGESNIAGNSTYKQDYSQMEVQRYDSNAFASTCGTVYLGTDNGNPSRWGTDAAACNDIRTWTG